MIPDEFINPALPLTDLHRHLEGSVRLTTVLEISRQYGQSLPAWDLPGLQKNVWIEQPAADIITIFPKFDLLRQIFVNLEVVRRVTRECLEDAAVEGLTHVELRFSPHFMAEIHGLSPLDVTAAVCEAWQENHDRFTMTSNLIVILSRTYGPEICAQEMDCALSYHGQGVAGVDLAGDEMRWPARLFADEFRKAHYAGLKVTAHAGEFAGADSIRETIVNLKPRRLGHAVRAMDDPTLMDEITRMNIAVECCPTSNYLTATIPHLSNHPLPMFLEHGICATLNTDDPSLMGSLTIQDEYRHAALDMGLTAGQLETIQMNGAKVSFGNQ
jgi:adenosine deaminase